MFGQKEHVIENVDLMAFTKDEWSSSSMQVLSSSLPYVVS